MPTFFNFKFGLLPEYFSECFADHFDWHKFENFEADIERKVKHDVPENGIKIDENSDKI
jgi:hypothetical protein